MALVPDVGEREIAKRINSTGTKPDWIASGTGTTAESETQTALITEVESRVQGTASNPQDARYQVVGQITYTATRAITEAGLFDANTSGNMYVRGVFSAINVVSGDKIEFTIQIDIT